MMCAHRYQQWVPVAFVAHLLTGQCYLLGDDLQAQVQVQQDKTWRRVFVTLNISAISGTTTIGIVRMEAIDDFPFPIDDPRETGDIDHFNPELIPLLRNSYLGFSIDSGLALIRKGELTIVSGAPRGGYSGQVAFLRPDPRAKKHLSVELVLSGPGLASSFGYDVAVADFNGDGWEDLAVGAPQFYKKDELILLLEHHMMGLAECIFTVARQTVLSSRSRSVTLFGYSLSGNLDVDDNLYPDLAVGSLSDSVFVYRARPVVRVSSTLRVTPDNIDITKEQCDKLLNYTFEADIRKSNVRLPPRVGFLGVPRGKLELPGQDMEI
ncbi:Integrin alpha-6 VLA-6, partial [Takifugu flavidus]